MKKPKIKVGSQWRHKADNYYVTIAEPPPNAPAGAIAHEVHRGVKLVAEKDFRAKFEPLPQ